MHDEPKALLGAVAAEDDAAIDLAGAALALAALDRPRVALERYRDHLVQIAENTAEAARGVADPAALAAALAEVLAGRHGYRGDALTYEDMQNANLMRVIDRRKGLPVALGILYIHAARAQGWQMAGLNFPFHFLIRLEAGSERLILDPFAGGKVLDAGDLRALLQNVAGADAELEPAYFGEAPNRAILIRLQNNIKSRALQSANIERAVDVLERMVMFAPDHAMAWRELGILRARQGKLQAATEAMETFLAREPDDAACHEAAVFLQSLRAKLN